MKKLKIWNGRGWGSRLYDNNGNFIKDPTGKKYCDHVYVCATSSKEAMELINNCVGYEAVTQYEISKYWSKGCWGKAMDGITPEKGVWTCQSLSDVPKRII